MFATPGGILAFFFKLANRRGSMYVNNVSKEVFKILH